MIGIVDQLDRSFRIILLGLVVRDKKIASRDPTSTNGRASISKSSRLKINPNKKDIVIFIIKILEKKTVKTPNPIISHHCVSPSNHDFIKFNDKHLPSQESK